MRDSIFVSYSHADQQAFTELHGALSALGAGLKIGVWDDTRLTPAAQWRVDIDEALATSAAAVLLLSPAFFASTFIRDYELPPLLAAARAGELRLFAVVLEPCAHEAVTDLFQAVNDPARPAMAADAAVRAEVWARVVSLMRDVMAGIDIEARIGAERVRLDYDATRVPAVAHVNDKVARARVDPAFNEHEAMRENTLVFLEGQLCQALATWLIEESKRTDLTPERLKAVVRFLQDVAHREEIASKRATELTQQFADETLAMLRQAQQKPPE